MVGDAAPLSEDVLEDTAYLSRSANRLRILEVIATAPHVPRAIADETDIPRSTLRRILTEIVERGWAERTLDGEYIATRTGEVVAAETGRYVGAIRAIRVLGDTVAWLPTEELTIGLRYFEDATVRRPEPNAMSAPSTFATELMRELPNSRVS